MMRAALWFAALVLTLSVLAAPRVAWAHEIDSAALTLTEVSPGRFSVRFRSSSSTLQRELASPAAFPKACRLEGSYLNCGSEGLVGAIEFPWQGGTLTKVMVEIQWLSGMRLLRVVPPSSASVSVYGIPPSAGLAQLKPIAVEYVKLGVEHILSGFDHLLFVIALAILVRGGAKLVSTVTAFTLAHSVSLAATVLGVVNVPAAPVEACIALSIVLVCAECLRSESSLTRRAPWAVAFVFGLLHGLGFASALLAIGLPENHVAAALACFNIGVELGQLAVIATVALVRWALVRARLHRPGLDTALIYAMGGVAAFWSLERIRAVFGA